MAVVLTHTEELFSGTITASGNTHSNSVNTKYDKEADIYLDITAVSGTNPTLDITIEDYNPKRDNWHTLATFSTKTGTGKDAGRIAENIGQGMAISYEIGGTNSPSFTLTVDVGLKSY